MWVTFTLEVVVTTFSVIVITFMHRSLRVVQCLQKCYSFYKCTESALSRNNWSFLYFYQTQAHLKVFPQCLERFLFVLHTLKFFPCKWSEEYFRLSKEEQWNMTVKRTEKIFRYTRLLYNYYVDAILVNGNFLYL